MKRATWILPLLLLALAGGALLASHTEWVSHADADGSANAAWEYKQVLIPLDRRLEHYPRANAERLETIQKLGREGWELVNAYEPSNGILVGRDASVEFWFKRRLR